jgi:hypothetical protein
MIGKAEKKPVMTCAPPIAHLTPGQDIAHKGRGHHQEINHEAEHPNELARCLVGAVVKAAENVDVRHDEEEARAVHVRVAQQPAGVDVAHDQLVHGIERTVARRVIVHRKDDARDDLDGQEDAGKNAEVPPVVEVAGHGITAADGTVGEARKRQALIEPAHDGMLGFIGLGPRKAHFVLTPLRRSLPSSAT